MTLATLTTILSRVGKAHPDLVSDEKVRRYILLVVEEGKKQPAEPPPLAPVGVSEI